MESDLNSLRSTGSGTPTSLRPPSSATAYANKKQVGFARPTLFIPPPRTGTTTPSIHTAATTARPLPSGHVYDRKASAFVFDQIGDFTKSGLGIGEKSAYWVYNKLRVWSRKWFTHIFLTLVLVLYTVGGAFLFQLIEGKQEEYVLQVEIIPLRDELVDRMMNINILDSNETFRHELKGIARRYIKEYELELFKINSANKLIEKGPQWSFWNAVIYCGTIYTTIGYGHIFPDTVTGKALTIVYAIIGIPLFLIALTDFGKLFTRCIKFFWSFVRRVYYTGNCRRARKTAHVQDLFKGAQMMYEIATFRRPSMFAADVENPEPSEDGTQPVGDDTPTTPAISNFEIDDEFNLPISLAIFILILYLLLGALMHCLFERWLFHDAFYFVFISMSTIGFGDMVIDNKYTMIISFVYLVFGLTLTSMCINVVQAKLSDTVKQASDKIGATIGFQVEEDGSVVTVAPDAVEMPETHEPLDNNKGAIEENMVAAPVPSSNNSSVKEPEE